jgi:hypothetical protein
MIQRKLKKCAGCSQEKVIWKAHGKEKYCKECWLSQSPAKPLAKPTSKPNAVSQKMKQTMSVYEKKRVAFLALHQYCQASLPDCNARATDVHHMAGRGENHNNMDTWLAVCRTCHQWIETNPAKARAMGFSLSRLDSTEKN